ncbi:GFA family protein [Sphingomonas sp. BT-65]|uniref:GFA family protein n=1 Tax=Sphingomonas sp. BT-65 TaxID=2989821 RepID=UPI0022358F17|nr:GFA family protein [Sphingomonas sp. BT-65]MCW4462222.1 GFA family protein [Sphingomonas sp. BT-65]
MSNRVASCSCGQLRLTCAGEPVRVSICHCLECQKRTGSVFATQARFAREEVTREGRSTTWTRAGDSGGSALFHFCPVCGSTVYWEPAEMPDLVYVAVGAFADPAFPAPYVSVYEERQHPWALAAGQLPLEHFF